MVIIVIIILIIIIIIIIIITIIIDNRNMDSDMGLLDYDCARGDSSSQRVTRDVSSSSSS
eukprot:7991375-Karenia_brevis.AAC.1